MEFNEAKLNFIKNFDVELLINQLKAIDKNNIRPGDYSAYGCEFILNGLNTNSEYYNAACFIEDDYPQVYSHGFELINHWDTFLFYSPTDFRGLLFDFSHFYSDNKIVAYDGLTLPITHNVVKTFTPKEFLKEYGMSKLYSVTHWRVTWNKLGFSWNN